MTSRAFQAFANNTQQHLIDDTLIADNSTDEVIISGEISIPNSKEGLNKIQNMISFLESIKSEMDHNKNIPEHIDIQQPETGTTDKSPFEI